MKTWYLMIHFEKIMTKCNGYSIVSYCQYFCVKCRYLINMYQIIFSGEQRFVILIMHCSICLFFFNVYIDCIENSNFTNDISLKKIVSNNVQKGSYLQKLQLYFLSVWQPKSLHEDNGFLRVGRKFKPIWNCKLCS